MTLETFLKPEFVAAAIFAIAVAHTFSTKIFSHLARIQPNHAGLWHLLGEVEVVFGFWALVMLIALFLLTGRDATITYLEARNFTEPMFVFVIMVIAASKPILNSVIAAVHGIAALAGRGASHLVPSPLRTHRAQFRQ